MVVLNNTLPSKVARSLAAALMLASPVPGVTVPGPPGGPPGGGAGGGGAPGGGAGGGGGPGRPRARRGICPGAWLGARSEALMDPLKDLPPAPPLGGSWLKRHPAPRVHCPR